MSQLNNTSKCAEFCACPFAERVAKKIGERAEKGQIALKGGNILKSASKWRLPPKQFTTPLMRPANSPKP